MRLERHSVERIRCGAGPRGGFHFTLPNFAFLWQRIGGRSRLSSPPSHSPAALPSPCRYRLRYRWGLSVLAVATGGIGSMSAQSSPADSGIVVRGGRVGWARLITGSRSWSVHQANDPALADFVRTQTSLNIDPKCYPVDPSKVAQLCEYPFIFTNNLTDVHDPKQLENLREYLRRGGFIYIDRCVNLSFSLPQETFYSRHLALFARWLPGLEVKEIPVSDDIFSCYFSVKPDQKPLRTGFGEPGHNGIYGVYDHGRMIVLLSLANYQCGWPDMAGRREACMKMITNIYVYAMTR